MGYSSQSGHMVLKTQATPGTFDPDTGTDGVGIYYRGGTLEPNRELLITDPEIGGGRDVVNAYLGAVAFSGDIEFYVREKMIQTLLASCFGDTALGTVTNGFTTNTFTPLDSGTLPFLSIEEAVSDGLETFNYTDAVVNTLHMEADANGYLTGTAGLIARLQTAGATPTDVGDISFDESPLYVGTNIALTLNGVALPAKSFSIDVNNQFEDDDFRLGSFYIGDLTAKRREITATFKIRESGAALWRRATYGTTTATAPGGLTTQTPLVVTITSYEAIPGATPNTTKYQIVLTFPNFILEPYALAIQGDDIIDSDISGRALRPSPGTPAVSVGVRTELAAIA